MRVSLLLAYSGSDTKAAAVSGGGGRGRDGGGVGVVVLVVSFRCRCFLPLKSPKTFYVVPGCPFPSLAFFPAARRSGSHISCQCIQL